MDSVSLTGTPTGTYNSKDVATATTVTFGGLALTGTGNGDYTLPTTASGAGNIKAAPLTVTATNESMVYGGTVPALTYTYTGLVNSETVTRSVVHW